MKNKILIIGDIMLDVYRYGSVNRISPEAPVPVIKHSHERSFGGGALNLALNYQSLAGDILLLGRVGDDSAGKKIVNICKKNNIKLLAVEGNYSSIVKRRFVSNGHQLLREDIEDIEPVEGDIIINTIQEVSPTHIMFSDYKKGLLFDIRKILAYCASRDIVTMIDPKIPDISHYSGVDYIKPNKEEFKKMVGLEKVDEQIVITEAKEWLRVGLVKRAVIVTLGGDGAICVSNDKIFRVNAKRVMVSDVTGAGDSFYAGLASKLCNNSGLLEAVEFAVMCGTSAVQKSGTTTVKKEEVCEK